MSTTATPSSVMPRSSAAESSGRRAARVATDRDLGAAEELRDGATDAVDVLGAHLVGHDAANVVGLEDRHGGAF